MFLPSSPERSEGRPQSPQHALRIAILGVVALAAFSVLIFRLWALQVLASNSYQKIAADNQIKVVRLPAPRGAILDAKGKVLVRNRPGLEVQLDPAALSDSVVRHDVIVRLSRLLAIAPRAAWERYDSETKLDPFGPVTLARDVEEPIVFYLKEHAASFPGVNVVKSPLRYYPYHSLAAHVFGQIAEIDQAHLDEPAYRSYTPGQQIGYNGVEGTYDQWLRGRDGKREVQVDAQGEPTGRTFDRPAAQPGYDLRLTIDEKIQQEAEAALKAGIRRASPNGADAGAIVALDPRNGAIKAIASLPSFDPNWLISPNRKAFKSHIRWLTSPKNPLTPQVNRAIAGRYPPGSTFKPVTAAAAIRAGVIGPYTVLPCTGSYTFFGTSFHNWDPNIDTGMSLSTALQESCDTFFYRLGGDIYKLKGSAGHPIQAMANKFGFGRDTGIDIAGENAGLVATPEWKRRFFKKGTWDYDWHPGDSVNLSIGQGNLLVTPLQMAVAYAAIANGGTVVRPHVGADIEQGGKVLKKLPFPARRKLGIADSTLAVIKDGLYQTTHADTGTASATFKSFPISVSGKTGTAQQPPHPDTAWFASYAPSDNPKLVVVVVIERGGHGGSTAAPTALDFYSRYFLHKPANLGSTITDNSR